MALQTEHNRVLPRILCVDDEPNVLNGLRLNLRKRFALTTAGGGQEALDVLQTSGPFEVLVSDMRMPGMSGAELLAQARRRHPNTVRILLTGQSDIESAVKAVNDGQLFRFLTKPCERPQLISTLGEAVKQHRLLTAEKDLLEKTLHGSVKALTDLLAATAPAVFGKAERVRKQVAVLCERLEIDPCWHIEVAAMLKDVGYVALPDDVAIKAVQGRALDDKQAAMVANVPKVTCQILQNIPRLDPVVRILEDLAKVGDGNALSREPGVRIIDACAEFDRLVSQGLSPAEATKAVQRGKERFGTDVIGGFESAEAANAKPGQVLDIDTLDLRAGMVLAEDATTNTGALLMAAGAELNAGSIERLRNFADSDRLNEPIRVLS